MPTEPRNTLLCVANFPANTGFAWDFIETLYARLAHRLAEHGIRTVVAYPRIDDPPGTLAGSPAEAVELPVRLESPGGWVSLLGFVRREKVHTVYLSDRPAWHPGYVLLRWAGVRHIVVHDHSSGKRTRPRGPKRWLKWAIKRIPGTLADRVIAVSEFVRRRAIEVGLVPPSRVHTVWNSLDAPERLPADSGPVRRRIGAPPERLLVACASRAATEKGIDVLLRAFDRILVREPGIEPRPFLVYMGDGPALGELRELRDSLASRDDILLTGYRDDANEVLGAADVCVVPSRWAEAFGMAALEPMAWGVPVVASRTGGLAEVVVDGETGRTVPPDDPIALARVLGDLLEDPEERRRLGARARRRVLDHFDMETQIDHLLEHLELPEGPGESKRRVERRRIQPPDGRS